MIGNSACETGTFLHCAPARDANLGTGASAASRLWITCGKGVDCLWMAVYRNNLIFLTASRGGKAYYWISIQANGHKKRDMGVDVPRPGEGVWP